MGDDSDDKGEKRRLGWWGWGKGGGQRRADADDDDGTVRVCVCVYVHARRTHTHTYTHTARARTCAPPKGRCARAAEVLGSSSDDMRDDDMRVWSVGE